MHNVSIQDVMQSRGLVKSAWLGRRFSATLRVVVFSGVLEKTIGEFIGASMSNREGTGRGLLRMRMCGGAARGAGYLLRLMFSPTEEDWGEARSPGPAWKQAVLRPLRLARKHRVEARGTGMGAD